ncbi:MAG: DUF1080 domain-containing protein, partial [Bacteroidetes bacterium]|nr:DUF1080 domain-containing protein [Bacteroidota bacterium]
MDTRPIRCLTAALTFLLLAALPSALPAAARQSSPLPMTEHDLTNLDGFRPVAGNWQIVGQVAADRSKDRDLSTMSGSGVLVNLPSAEARDNIFTDWEHGDIELHLEFMMPRGSNSGIYLQGRYEIQLFDSWNNPSPGFDDAGGIYQRWDPARPDDQRGYEGHPPRMNVSRAPGLWQTLQIHFQAPRFDANGRKTANARMVRVLHNGVSVHENVELTGPTRASAFEDEVPMGPLMIQGDHGPVAIRNIRYKRYQPESVTLSGLTYASAEGDFSALPDFSTLETTSGPAEGIDWRAAGATNQFALHFSGTIHVPHDGLYRFQLGFDWVTGDPHYMNAKVGAGSLQIDGRTVLTHSGKERAEAGDVRLEAGQHTFSLAWFKNKPGRDAGVSLFVEGDHTELQSLNAPGALPQPRIVPAIHVEPGQKPEVIRGFVQHEGVKKTRTIAVGDPTGVHYVFDSEQGAVIQIWKGAFIEATDMWHSRGQEQLAVPRGSVIDLSGAPTVALLDGPNEDWPDTVGAHYAFNGYDLDETGHPTFHYAVGDVQVADHLAPGGNGQMLIRDLKIEGNADMAWVRVITAPS